MPSGGPELEALLDRLEAIPAADEGHRLLTTVFENIDARSIMPLEFFFEVY